MLVSAGFDAHDDDPLADMRVTEDGFRELARRCAGARATAVAAVLEGGYNLETLPGLVDAALDGFSSQRAKANGPFVGGRLLPQSLLIRHRSMLEGPHGLQVSSTGRRGNSSPRAW